MVQIATQQLEVDDFSGGMTDHYINAPMNRGQRFDNLFILPNKKLLSRWGSELDDDSVNAQIPAGNQRIGTLINYNNSSTLFVQSAKKFYYRNTSAYTTLVGPVTSNDVFNEGTTSSFVSYAEWNRHLYVTNDSFPNVSRIYTDGSGVIQVRTAGLPALANAPTVTAGSAGANSYLYAFHYFFTYTIGTQVFEDRGPVKLVELASSLEPSASNNAITVIPVLANGATLNYATTTIKVHIFRTLNGGVDYFKIGEVTNGTTVFTDNVSDSTAEDGEPIYTTGGVLDNDPPPLCKYIHIVNNVGYYAHVKEGSEVFPNKYKISVPFDPDSVPGGNEDEVEDEITGISSVASIPIIGCKRHIYRSEGVFDEFGRGSLNHTRISDNAGCLSNLSFVQAEGGLYWAGNDGFYYTDGYRVMKISDHLNTTYAAYIAEMTNTKRIVGKFDEKYRRVLWTIQADSASADNDILAVLELRWGISSEMVFTTMSGSTSFSPSSIEFFDKKLYRADHRGFVFVHDEDLDADPKVDLTKAAADWDRVTIIYDYVGPATNFGTTLGRKWVPKAVITLGNYGNVSVQPNAINDDGDRTRNLKEIRFRGSFIWGDDEFLWGNNECEWRGGGVLENWRRMPAGGLRLSYFQLQLTNALTVVSNSDLYGNVTIDTTLKQADLVDAAINWPSDAVDYYLSFAADDYVTQYLVSARTSDQVLTFVDSANTAPSGNQEWLLKGYKKGERMNLLSYAVLYSSSSQSQKTYQASDSGANT